MSQLFEFSDDREASSAAKVRALEALLIEKGVIATDSVDVVLKHFETMAGPFNGAKIVARAWVDPQYARRLVEDTPKAIAELSLPLGMTGAEGEHMAAVANDANVHNLIICTLCSCYPWPVLGLPPYWYKDPVFRARGVREPRAVLQEFGVQVPATKEVKCSVASDNPSGRRIGLSSADTVGSPIQPRPRDAMVMPSWQQAR